MILEQVRARLRAWLLAIIRARTPTGVVDYNDYDTIRARILAGVADYNEYDLTDDEDRLEAEAETDTIMAHLFTQKKGQQ